MDWFDLYDNVSYCIELLVLIWFFWAHNNTNLYLAIPISIEVKVLYQFLVKPMFTLPVEQIAEQIAEVITVSLF